MSLTFAAGGQSFFFAHRLKKWLQKSDKYVII